MKYIVILALAFAALSVGSCGSKKYVNENVIVHELSDADMLNPYNYSDAGAGYIMSIVFQSLLGIDFKSLELVPQLAASRPEISVRPEGGMLITYHIRPEAAWDNGDPITAKDIEFSLKVIKNPKVNCQRLTPYYEFIQDMVFYDDPRKFTFICKDVYILAESSSGDFSVIPSKVYDPKGLMSKFSIKDMNEKAAELANDPDINEFAGEFNSEKYMREPGFVVGSGAYELTEWQTGQKMVLKRKENWWGSKLNDVNVYFEAYAPQLIYQTINDQTTALVALKAGNLDVMRGIKSKDFVDLPNSEKFNANFNAFTPPMLAYTYLGMNTRLPKFADKRTRQALAHLLDVDKIINTVFYNMSVRVVGPINPLKTKEYNTNLVPYDFNIEKAKQLLADAGWKDANGDGVVEKVIDGKKTDFIIEFTYNAGNDERKAVALMLQETARKAGITINVRSQEWSVYLDNLKNHRFEMYYGSWISAPVPNDHKQIYHTESYNGGSNYTGFGNDESDALIDSIRVTLDEEKRAEMNKRFQAMLHDQVPYIFIGSPKERIAIHKRFSNAETYTMRPGYWEPGLRASAL